MTDEENVFEPELPNIEENNLYLDSAGNFDDIVKEPDKLQETLDEAYERMPIKYSFNLTQTSNSNTYKTVFELSTLLSLGYVRNKTKYIVASKLEIIAKSPDFDGPKGIIINVLDTTPKESYSFGKKYNNPKKLQKDYEKLITKIKKAHMDNYSLSMDLYPIDPKPQD